MFVVTIDLHEKTIIVFSFSPSCLFAQLFFSENLELHYIKPFYYQIPTHSMVELFCGFSIKRTLLTSSNM